MKLRYYLLVILVSNAISVASIIYVARSDAKVINQLTLDLESSCQKRIKQAGQR